MGSINDVIDVLRQAPTNVEIVIMPSAKRQPTGRIDTKAIEVRWLVG